LSILGPISENQICAIAPLSSCGCDCCTCADGGLPRCASGTTPYGVAKPYVPNAIEVFATAESTDGYPGHTAYVVSVRALKRRAKSIYVLFGDRDWALRLPPAHHVPAPFGVNIGVRQAQL
jgi:hypothetical protein